MNIRLFAITLLFCLFASVAVQAQQKGVTTDANTPLHLLTPDYPVPYKEWQATEIKELMDRILAYLDRVTPYRLIDGASGQPITDFTKINQDARLAQGDFRLTSYEWGVTYSGMLAAARVSGDGRYLDYVGRRLGLLTDIAPYFTRLSRQGHKPEGPIRQLIRPAALDDAGAVCAAMIKASQSIPALKAENCIRNYMEFILHQEYRLSDGTFARMRPQANTVWLDDMYMAIPAIAQMGLYTDSSFYFDTAIQQVNLFAEKMFVKEKGLFRHGWVAAATDHPAFFWARANGWALLTLTELLDVLPEGYQGRKELLGLYQAQVSGIASRQSGSGFWHQLLDRNDSFLETSATAIFTYCIARGINKGWLDAISYGPVAQLGWSALSTKINKQGQVEGTCVGTGMAFDPAYYYHRPVNNFAAHGYGPVLLAGAEMMALLKQLYPRMNDSAIQYYLQEQKSPKPIFGVDGKTY
ncbi:glycoside hydrolase family 88 protein [Niabella terrae]